MKKLLVCGDSFAELSGYRNHYTTSKFAEPNLGGSWHVEFKHWCELLADDVGMTVVPHGIGGAGVSSSSYVAFQQLLSNQYHGVVFFVSHHARTMINRSQSIEEWQQHVEPRVCINHGPLNKIYDPEQFHSPYKYFKTHYHRSVKDNNINIPQVTHYTAEDIASDNDGSVEHLTDSVVDYLTYKPAYSYIHDSVTAVLALKALCDAKGIPLILASCFSDGVCDAIHNMGINIKHFPFYKCETYYKFQARYDFPSHYNGEEHEIIYNDFKGRYPEYISMFD